MERFLVRLQSVDPRAWILKGGLALELRLRDRARSTKDIDLGADLFVTGAAVDESTPGRIGEAMRIACEEDPGDYFRFLLPEEWERDLGIEGVDAFRYSVVAELAERTFDRFQLDVALHDSGPTAPEDVEGSGLLSFAGLPVERFLAVSRARHLAEKLHALTRPRDAPTRVRDLVDVLLLLDLGPGPVEDVRAEVQAVFAARTTHALPRVIPDPPAAWRDSFEDEAAQTGLGPMSLDTAAMRLRTLWKDLGLEES